mmetsp:Transcript_14557/g.25909  ORF Transcript_14557/g.25909 Transcript_14557/m.25909 type:complete len:460 (+) Transcript_14557:11938-13317(+)
MRSSSPGDCSTGLDVAVSDVDCLSTLAKTRTGGGDHHLDFGAGQRSVCRLHTDGREVEHTLHRGREHGVLEAVGPNVHVAHHRPDRGHVGDKPEVQVGIAVLVPGKVEGTMPVGSSIEALGMNGLVRIGAPPDRTGDPNLGDGDVLPTDGCSGGSQDVVHSDHASRHCGRHSDASLAQHHGSCLQRAPRQGVQIVRSANGVHKSVDDDVGDEVVGHEALTLEHERRVQVAYVGVQRSEEEPEGGGLVCLEMGTSQVADLEIPSSGEGAHCTGLARGPVGPPQLAWDDPVGDKQLLPALAGAGRGDLQAHVDRLPRQHTRGIRIVEADIDCPLGLDQDRGRDGAFHEVLCLEPERDAGLQDGGVLWCEPNIDVEGCDREMALALHNAAQVGCVVRGAQNLGAGIIRSAPPHATALHQCCRDQDYLILLRVGSSSGDEGDDDLFATEGSGRRHNCLSSYKG